MDLVQVLPQLINHIGGPSYGHRLLEILFDQLFVRSDADLREKVQQSIRKVLGRVNIRQNERIIMDMVQQLASIANEDSKKSILFLMSEIYIGISPEAQQTLMLIFEEFAHDKAPSIRRAAVSYLKELIKMIPITPEGLLRQLFQQLLQDENELVRQNLLESLIPLSQVPRAPPSNLT